MISLMLRPEAWAAKIVLSERPYGVSHSDKITTCASLGTGLPSGVVCCTTGTRRRASSAISSFKITSSVATVRKKVSPASFRNIWTVVPDEAGRMSVPPPAGVGWKSNVSSEAVARGEIIEISFSVSGTSARSDFSLSSSRIMLCSPVEFAGPINLMSILSRTSSAS